MPPLPQPIQLRNPRTDSRYTPTKPIHNPLQNLTPSQRPSPSPKPTNMLQIKTHPLNRRPKHIDHKSPQRKRSNSRIKHQRNIKPKQTPQRRKHKGENHTSSPNLRLLMTIRRPNRQKHSSKPTPPSKNHDPTIKNPSRQHKGHNRRKTFQGKRKMRTEDQRR
ncbi:hypothetical protein N7448_009399 [Penicillium atrosanguineum]|nr:hypothetical protein N7448_009399 [Penicillium atrosanguineum]KAJ5141934.1 hypothetical protein N7526_002929 [Penicillium atrosanguineum]